ncbi:MAG: hypothetical protein K2G85_09420 [Muribaculaceae bacterium]|nr:hypothetical protein [Muribaculaceae bacterium]
MRKKIYVDGGIVIKTPYFKCKEAGARFDIPYADVDKIATNDSINGHPCLVITDEHIPSIFNEYYAKDFLSTNTKWASIFSNKVEDCFSTFNIKIDDVKNLVALNDICDQTRQTLYLLSLLSCVAALDTLISDLVIFAASRESDIFLRVVDLLYSGNSKAKMLERILHMWCDNVLDSAEQEIFESILKMSYSSSKEIKNFLNQVYGISVSIGEKLKQAIHIRHIVAHRNGRQKDGSYYVLTKDELFSIITEVHKFGESLRDPIIKWCSSKNLKE